MNEENEKLWWKMSDLVKVTGETRQWLTSEFLRVERWRKMLDLENGGFVYYSCGKRDEWKFLAEPMRKFIVEWWPEIIKESKRKNKVAG